ncbi:MAG TPA: hypothetical protein VJ974_01875 [Geopsychrobacteraceae bacterium]|nr:hypothetical protein [Geopsychrobacteraceae bacterium]
MKSQTNRTIREFCYKPDLWPVIDSWAAKYGFILQVQEPACRLYRKGHLLLFGPAMLEVTQQQD